jgi:hypothetical protein
MFSEAEFKKKAVISISDENTADPALYYTANMA